MKLRLVSILALACNAGLFAHADSIIVFNDLTSSPFVTLNGNKITGVGGVVSAFSSTSGGEDITFDLSQVAGRVILPRAIYTDLLESSGGPTSDRFVAQDLSITKFNVAFGSVPGGTLPSIPGGAIAYTGPLVENGTNQLVGRVQIGATDFYDFYIDSPAAPASSPEPASVLLGGTMLALVGIVFRRKWARSN